MSDAGQRSGDVRKFFDDYAAAAGNQGVLRVGKLAAATEVGQQIIAEAARRGIPVKLDGATDQ